MSDDTYLDPDLEEAFVAQVERGEFADVDAARADFLASLDEDLEAEERGDPGIDAEIVFAELRERYANWPRAAE